MEKNKPIKNELTLELIVSPEQFANEDGALINYFSYKVKIGNEVFRLHPKSEDKRMINYLLNDLFSSLKTDEAL